MAVCGPPIALARRVALRGAYTLTVDRGRIIAAAWPRGHRARPKKTERARREWMQNIVAATKYADPGTVALIRDQVGGSATLARDLLVMMIHGTAFAVQRADGRWLMPIRFRNLLWAALDKIATPEGGPLARHPQRWITASPAATGTVLTSNGPDQTPTFQPL